MKKSPSRARANADAWHVGCGAAFGAKHRRGSSVTLGERTVNLNNPFREEAIRQLADDILSYGWLRQMASLDFGYDAGSESRNAVFDLVHDLVGSGIAVVGYARNHQKMVLVHAWPEQGNALQQRMARELLSSSTEDQDCVFWLQLSAHYTKDQKGA